MTRSVLSDYDGVSFDLRTTNRIDGANISIIKEMVYLAENERRAGRSIISLGVGIPYYRMPESLGEAAIYALKNKESIDKYTFFAGLPKLRKLLAEKSEKELGMPVSENQILVTPGSMAGLLYTALTLFEPGDEVILPSPYFPSYAEQIRLAGAKIVEVPLVEGDEGYRLDVKSIKKNITPNTKAVIVNSPQNPTGAVYDKKDLEELADHIAGKNIYVITDEVYDFLTYDGVKNFNIASIGKLWPYVVRCLSFSKIFGMTGWRIGYVHTNERLLKHLLKVHDNTIVCAPHIAQEAVVAGVLQMPAEVAQNVESLSRNRDLIMSRLNRLKNFFSYVKPKGAYYIFPKFSLKMGSVEFAVKLLKNAGVVVVPGVGFGAVAEGHVRMCFGVREGEINEAFDRIEKLKW